MSTDINYGRAFVPVKNMLHLLELLRDAAESKAEISWEDSDLDAWMVSSRNFGGELRHAALNRTAFLERLRDLPDPLEHLKDDDRNEDNPEATIGTFHGKPDSHCHRCGTGQRVEPAYMCQPCLDAVNGYVAAMNIDLQLLCIVLDENTVVVKVEKGDAMLTFSECYSDKSGHITQSSHSLHEGETHVIRKSFEKVRSAIDALEGEKPEYCVLKSTDGEAYVTLPHYGQLDADAYNDISKMFGDLPIYEPTKGEWQSIVRAGKSEGMDFRPDFSVWRYVRRKG